MSSTNAPERQGARPRRTPQNAQVRDHLRAEYDDALATLGRIEADAGPTLQEELSRSKRIQAAYRIGEERELFRRRRLAQRSGLLKLLRAELGATDPAFTPRVWEYVHKMLIASANVAAVTGSLWPSTLSWFRSRLPTLTAEYADHMQAAFDMYVEESKAELARRIPSGDPNLYTDQTPAEIAADLGTTTAHLRKAQANTCGLTSIDSQDRRTRDRERKAETRLRDGRKPQAERTTKAEMQTLAARLGVGIATLYRKRLAGTLDAFVEAHSQGDTEVSALIRTLDGGHFGITPANDDDALARTA